MCRDRLSRWAAGDAGGLGEAIAVREAVSHAQECKLAVHRNHGKLWHVLAVCYDDADPVAPAGYEETLRPRRGVPVHGEGQHDVFAHCVGEVERPVGDGVL